MSAAFVKLEPIDSMADTPDSLPVASSGIVFCAPTAAAAATFGCAVCGRQEASRDRLEVHVTVDHLEWIPYECKYCANVFLPTERALRDHSRGAHPMLPLTVSFKVNDQKKAQLDEIIQRSLSGERPSQGELVFGAANSLLWPPPSADFHASTPATPPPVESVGSGSNDALVDDLKPFDAYFGEDDSSFNGTSASAPSLRHSELDAADMSANAEERATSSGGRGGKALVCVVCSKHIADLRGVKTHATTHLDGGGKKLKMSNMSIDRQMALINRCFGGQLGGWNLHKRSRQTAKLSMRSALRRNLSTTAPTSSSAERIPSPEPKHAKLEEARSTGAVSESKPPGARRSWCNVCHREVPENSKSTHLWRFHMSRRPLRCACGDKRRWVTRAEALLHTRHAKPGAVRCALIYEGREQSPAEYDGLFFKCYGRTPRPKHGAVGGGGGGGGDGPKEECSWPSSRAAANETGMRACHCCGSQVSLGSLRYHVWRAHLIERPIVCGYCPYPLPGANVIFSAAHSSMRAHMASRHAALPFRVVDNRARLRQQHNTVLAECFPPLVAAAASPARSDADELTTARKPVAPPPRRRQSVYGTRSSTRAAALEAPQPVETADVGDAVTSLMVDMISDICAAEEAVKREGAR